MSAMTVWKYPLAVQDRQTLDLPVGAQVLTVQVQDDVPCLWALVDVTAPTTPRVFHLRGTGHNADGVASALYVGTFQLHDGALVFHLFAEA